MKTIFLIMNLLSLTLPAHAKESHAHTVPHLDNIHYMKVVNLPNLDQPQPTPAQDQDNTVHEGEQTKEKEAQVEQIKDKRVPQANLNKEDTKQEEASQADLNKKNTKPFLSALQAEPTKKDKEDTNPLPPASPTFSEVLHQETIPYPSETISAPDLIKGETQLVQEGKPGQFTVVGVFAKDPTTGETKQVDEQEELIQPVPEVVAHGTKEVKSQSPVTPTPAQSTGTTFDILETGTLPPKLVEGVDFKITNQLYPGPVSAGNYLYRQDYSLYSQHYGVSSTFSPGNIYYAEVMTPVGGLFADLQLGEEVVLDGQLYSVKAIEYPFTAHRDTFIPAYTTPHGVYKPAENTKSLWKHMDYIQSYYHTPTAKMVQVCADPRMYHQPEHGVFTNKAIILDLADGTNYGKGNLYPLERNNFVPALPGVNF